MAALIGFGFVVIFGMGLPLLLGFTARAEYRRELEKETP